MSGRPAAPQPIPSVADAGTRTVSPDGWVLTTTSGLTLPELYGILQLRSRVFVVEQESLYLDLDGLDLLPGTLHLMLPAPGEVLRPAKDSHGGASGLSAEPRGYARILPDGYEDGPLLVPVRAASAESSRHRKPAAEASAACSCRRPSACSARRT